MIVFLDEIFADAITLPESRLGANDRLHLATCQAHGITSIVTADQSFDEIATLARIDPLDAISLRRLLTD